MKLDPQEVQLSLDVMAHENFACFADQAFVQLEAGQIDQNWHLDALTHRIQQIARGKIKRLLINVPPRSLKSFYGSVCLPAFILGHRPNAKIICASYANTLSEKFSADCRTLMRSNWYRRIFPGTTLNPQKQGVDEFATTTGGFRLATSTGGTLTGRGGDFIIIDDPLKAGDANSEVARNNCIEWFQNTVQTRLNDPKTGQIIVIAQRLHQQDLCGHLIENGGWDELILPAEFHHDCEIPIDQQRSAEIAAPFLLHESRLGSKELEGLKKEMGERDYEAQYNQRPLPPGGALFKRKWIRRYLGNPKLTEYEFIVQSWDTAYEVKETNDYSACTTWGILNGHFHLLDVLRKRLEYPDLEKTLLKQQSIWHARLVIVEKAGSGISLYQSLRNGGNCLWLKQLTPQNGKVDRASQQTPKFERGEVWFPEKAPWLQEFEDELFEFPNSKHDDQVDSAVQFLTATDYSSFRQQLGTNYG